FGSMFIASSVGTGVCLGHSVVHSCAPADQPRYSRYTNLRTWSTDATPRCEHDRAPARGPQRLIIVITRDARKLGTSKTAIPRRRLAITTVLRYFTAAPNNVPTAAVTSIASAPQNVTRSAPARIGAPPV